MQRNYETKLEAKTGTQQQESNSKSNIISDQKSRDDDPNEAESRRHNRQNLSSEERKMSPEVKKKRTSDNIIDRKVRRDVNDEYDESKKKVEEEIVIVTQVGTDVDEDGDRLPVNVMMTANPIQVNMESKKDGNEETIEYIDEESKEEPSKSRKTLAFNDSLDAGMSSLTPRGTSSAISSTLMTSASLISESSTTSISASSASPPTVKYALKPSSKPRLLRQAASVMVEAFDSFAARASSFGISRGNSRDGKESGKESSSTSKEKDSSSSSIHKPRPKLIERLQKSSSEPSSSVSFRSRSLDDQQNMSIEETVEPFPFDVETTENCQVTGNKDVAQEKEVQLSQNKGNQLKEEVDTITSSSSSTHVNPFALSKRQSSKSSDIQHKHQSVTTAVVVQTEEATTTEEESIESVDNTKRKESKTNPEKEKSSKTPPTTPRMLSLRRKSAKDSDQRQEQPHHQRQVTQTTTIETTDESLYQITSLNSTDISGLGDSFSSSTTSGGGNDSKKSREGQMTTVMGKIKEQFKSSGLVMFLPSGRKSKSVDVSSSNLHKEDSSLESATIITDGINHAKNAKKDHSHSSSFVNLRATTNPTTSSSPVNKPLSPVCHGSRSPVSPSSSSSLQHLNKPSVRAISLTSMSGATDNLLAPIIEENNPQQSNNTPFKNSLSDKEQTNSPLSDVSNMTKTELTQLNGNDLKEKTSKNNSMKLSMKEETFDAENILGIHIHNTDRKLKCAKLVLHPVIKVHVIDIKTGKYLKKKHPRRNVTSYYENHNRISSLEYILPIMTQPCDLVQYIRYPRAPIWEELLLYNEDYDYFLRNEVIFFFEVMDFVSLDSLEASKKSGVGIKLSTSAHNLPTQPQPTPPPPSSQYHPSTLNQLSSKNKDNDKSNNINKIRKDRKKTPQIWWHRIAWTFLRVVGGDGSLNVRKKLRLQLFKPISPKISSGISSCFSSPGSTPIHMSSNTTGCTTTDLFSWWSEDKRLPFPGSIYITIKPIPLAQSLVKVKPSLRSLLPFQEELGGASLAQMLAQNLGNQTSESMTTDSINSREYYQTTMSHGALDIKIRKKRKKSPSSVNKANNDSITGTEEVKTARNTRRKETASLKAVNTRSKNRPSGNRTMSDGDQGTIEQEEEDENEDEDDLPSQEEYEEDEEGHQYTRNDIQNLSRGLKSEGVRISPSGLVLDPTNCSLWPQRQTQTECKIPKFPWKDFSAGNNRSCYSLKFSHDGRKLVCGASVFAAYLSAEKRSSLFMYELPSGNFFRRVNGFHLGTIYDIDWSFDDRFVMSASNDCTAQIWSVEKEKHSSVVLPHPCFIYSCKFCPQKEYQYLIFTGAFDGIIRLWSVRKCWENHPGLSKDPELLREIDGFQGQVLSLCFKAFPMISPRSRTGTMSAKVNNNNNNNGISSSSHQHQGFNNNYNNNIYTEELVLFSAGSNGSITLWKHKRETSTGIYDISHWLPTGKIRVPELKGIPINCIKISPSGSKMLCCCRDGVLRMIDYDLETVVRTYPGSANFSHLIRGSLSPCGKFVFMGSEDGAAHVWAADTGERIYTYDGLPFKGPVTCIEYHPFDQVVAMCGLGGRTVSVLCYKYRDPTDPETPIDQSPAGSMEQYNQHHQQQNQGAGPIHIQVSMGSTERSKDHSIHVNPFPRPLLPPPVLSKIPVGLTPAQRRWKLQKSMTLDSPSGSPVFRGVSPRGSPSAYRGQNLSQKTAPSSPRHIHRSQQNFFKGQKSTSIEYPTSSYQTSPHHQSPSHSPSRQPPVNLDQLPNQPHASPESRMKRAMKKLEIALKMKSLEAASSSRVKDS